MWLDAVLSCVLCWLGGWQVLLDNADSEWDGVISDFILSSNEVEGTTANRRRRSGGSPHSGGGGSGGGGGTQRGFHADGSGYHDRRRRHHRAGGSAEGTPRAAAAAADSGKYKPGHPLYKQSPSLRHHDQVWNLRKLKAYLVCVRIPLDRGPGAGLCKTLVQGC